MNRLWDQQGVNAALHPDGYTISIVTTTPPTYMVFDSRSKTIQGTQLENVTPNLHGFCMGVIPATSQPVMCGGSSNGVYTTNCVLLSAAVRTPTVFATFNSPQDGCAFIPYNTGFLIIPGFLAQYHSVIPPVDTRNPSMSVFDMKTNNWSTIPNDQDVFLLIRPYSQVTVMPGTDSAVLYGGSGLRGEHYTDILVFNLKTNIWGRTLEPAPGQYVKSNSSSLVPSPSPTPDNGPVTRLSTPAIIGIVIGSLFVLGLVGSIFFYVRRRRHYTPAERTDREDGQNPWPHNVKVEPASLALLPASVPTHSIPADVSTTQSPLPGQQLQSTLQQQLRNTSTRNGIVSESGLSQTQTPRPRLFLTAVEVPLYRKPTPTTAPSHWPIPPAPSLAPFLAPASVPIHAVTPAPTTVPAMPSAEPRPPKRRVNGEEETPFAEGVLGSAAIRYRPYVVPSRAEQATRASAEKSVAALSKTSRKNKLQSFEVAGRITPFLRGGSIVKAEDIKTFVGIMEDAGDMDGKKYILNALLSTKPLPILTRFVHSTGPSIILAWMAEARKNVQDPRCQDILLKILRILKALPWEVETSVKIKLERMVKNLATEKDGIPDIIKSATELLEKWNNTNSSSEHTSSRLTRASTTESARRARPNPGTDNIFGGQHQDLFPLPKFTKASTSTPKTPSVVAANHNFFKEIASPSTPTQTTKKMPARLNISTRPQQDNRGGSSPPASASSSSPSVLTTVPSTRSRRPPSDSTPAQRPQAESAPPQFNIAKEAVWRSSHTSSSSSSAPSSKPPDRTPKKTVRFKGDHELVQTRFIERVIYESTDEDEDDYDEGTDRSNDYSSSSIDMDVDMDTEMEVDDGYSPSFWPPFFAPSTPAPTPQPSTAPSRPAFIMTPQEMEDLVTGKMWRLPMPLSIEHEYTVANGQESAETATQAEREARNPAAVYSSLAMIPPSPVEPDSETDDESLPRQIALFEESTDPAQVLLGSLTQLAQYLAFRSHVDTQHQVPLPPQ
ncbi:hypothetical protein BG011_000438 [Mortierella polycephala]|uniref:TFIIS N-terminal domain-containing protein n=1 Tax=Mortierella polycephala TaxID=41804 RepID=A0A9P6U5Z5_9FUNG|nr:hypothetical protein BG011_000438 [Mortierella polycephala]